MFTGIIEDLGEVQSISAGRLCILTSLSDIKIGDSVSVCGVCLTAVSVKNGEIAFDYSPLTDKLTTLSELKTGSKVNLERALTLSSRLGGHIILGHIEGKARIEKIEKTDRFFKVIFSCGGEILKYCSDKGSIAADGISLTVSKVLNGGFEVFIIPQTFENTNMHLKRTGGFVNIESDVLIKYLERLLVCGQIEHRSIDGKSALSKSGVFEKDEESGASLMDALKNNGFI
ncbi:MAG: riboflavin synthase [Elusimicrobiota bacterium]|nr:riboflavin synthase [Elusimicrobiota bacterium]